MSKQVDGCRVIGLDEGGIDEWVGLMYERGRLIVDFDSIFKQKCYVKTCKESNLKKDFLTSNFFQPLKSNLGLKT